ncbi:CRISPR-associated helicase/endonuclease Cas3 [Gemmatimonadetes bacterium T265]|nr:CRISPR-associated helicase/endonuclease Cas3 [Gemmatimonadetes bacterium T265]
MVTRARLAYLVHLHDCGKVNVGFQARRDRGAPRVGHIAPLAAIVGDAADPDLSAAAFSALRGERLASWVYPASRGALLDAVFSHHGRPWARTDVRAQDRRHWRSSLDGYDPIRALAALRADADAFLPGAHTTGAPSLPESEGFVHAFAGLIQLADWIASSDWEHAPDDDGRRAWAASRLREIGLDPEPWRSRLCAAGLPSFEAIFSYPPHPHQREAGTAPGQLVVVESETGSGKTEAALWRFATLFARGAVDGLYFALPTRTAAVQLHQRVERFARALWPDDPPPVVLAVPGYLDRATRRVSAGELPVATDRMDDAERDERRAPVWASEHPKRYFAAMLSVGTVDQALLAALRVKHAHLRGAALMRHLLVVDEVHASDAYIRRVLGHLLRDHVDAGGHAVLLSATLGAKARRQFLTEAGGGRVADDVVPSLRDAAATPYPLLSLGAPDGPPLPIAAMSTDKAVTMELREWLDDPAAIAGAALDAARAGAKVLVVRNTVDGAVAVQRALEAAAATDDAMVFRVRGVATLHHGRFARADRQLLDAAVEATVGRTRPRGGVVVVGTQTLEQSLDLDADLLVTDLCPADVLLQRLGRLHRHATDRTGNPRVRPEPYRGARAVVLVPAGGLAPFLRPGRPGGLSRHGLGHRIVDGVPQGVYRDLTVLEATRRLVADHGTWRIPAVNRALVEGALHDDAVEALIAGMPEPEREAWRAHRNAVEGSALADGQVAADGLLWRSRPLMEEPNTRFDDRLVTRLGADDRLVDLPSASVGPLGELVDRLVVPSWMARGLPPNNDVPVAVTREPEGRAPGARLQVQVGDLAFIYDRHGLRRAEEA